MKKKKSNLHIGEHGGSLLIGKRKCKRPLKVGIPIHIVLRSEFAHGQRMLLKHTKKINRVIDKASELFHIQVFERAINTNHIHLLIRGYEREDIQNFLRVYAGHTAQKILAECPLAPYEEKKSPLPNKFWQSRIYSRLVGWVRDFDTVIQYLIRNVLEAKGEIPYTPRVKNTS